MLRHAWGLVALAVVLTTGACSQGDGTAASGAVTVAVGDGRAVSPAPGPETGAGGLAAGDTTGGATADVVTRKPLPGFGEIGARIVDAEGNVIEACLLLADDTETRRQGLMGVTDPELGGYAGMLFRFDEPTRGTFWMKDTPMPLSIAWFADGDFVSSADMEPCPSGTDCPHYAPAGPYTEAVEVPAGRFDRLGIGPGSRLTTTAACLS